MKKIITKLAIVLCSLLLVSASANAGVKIMVIGGEAAGADYSDITFWLNFEDGAESPYELGTSECSSGDTTAVHNDSIVINNDITIVGSYTLDVADAAKYLRFDSASIIGTSGRLGFYINITTWVNFAGLIYMGTTHTVTLVMINNDELRFRIADGNNNDATTASANLGTGTDYFIELVWDTTQSDGSDVMRIFIDGSEEATNTSASIDNLSVDRIFIGEGQGNDSDYAMDNVMVSSDTTRDFNALKDETTVPSGACP